MHRKKIVLGLLAAGLLLAAAGGVGAAETAPLTLDQCNVVWDSPGGDSSASMPLGNGDIGLNVWCDSSGDLLFYISKTDAWSDNVRGEYGLPKVGRVRMKLVPNPFHKGDAFRQTLHLREGRIVVTLGSAESSAEWTVWVDALRPVIHVEAQARQPIVVQAAVEPYRTKARGGLNADIVFEGQKDRVAWCYRNRSKEARQLENLTFGAVIQGPGFTSTGDNQTLQSAAEKALRVDICVLTAQAETPESWLTQLEAAAKAAGEVPIERARQDHLEWWRKFWDRSWIFLGGDDTARKAGQGYILQRFVQGCMGRGAYPMKFNGGLFTADLTFRRDNRTRTVNADFRDWGGQYWFQNTRAMYWPLLATGDFEMMLPLFRMGQAEIAFNAPKVKEFYGHEGSYIAETAPFWGGIQRIRRESPGNYTDRYFTPVLELTMMMLDYYEYTGDQAIVRETIVPVASAGLTFFEQHFPRDAQGKILFDQDNSIEMYWKVRNPLPDIAGLHAVLGRLLALPDDLVEPAARARWKKMAGELPEIPMGIRRGKKALLPMADGQDERRIHNGENPELYAIYPFRLYGLGMPDLDLARHTFEIRRQKNRGCWVQDPVQAAMLGLTDVAKTHVVFDLTRKDPNVRFPAFWDHANDYIPDEDNGGNGMHGLQLMLMQSVGRKILLLPAWPSQWNASFKLHAPFQTTVEGTVRNGRLEGLKVLPEERRKDVEVLGAAGESSHP
jgi:alpha-L-fucosidase 2